LNWCQKFGKFSFKINDNLVSHSQNSLPPKLHNIHQTLSSSLPLFSAALINYLEKLRAQLFPSNQNGGREDVAFWLLEDICFEKIWESGCNGWMGDLPTNQSVSSTIGLNPKIFELTPKFVAFNQLISIWDALFLNFIHFILNWWTFCWTVSQICPIINYWPVGQWSMPEWWLILIRHSNSNIGEEIIKFGIREWEEEGTNQPQQWMGPPDNMRMQKNYKRKWKGHPHFWAAIHTGNSHFPSNLAFIWKVWAIFAKLKWSNLHIFGKFAFLFSLLKWIYTCIWAGSQFLSHQTHSQSNFEGIHPCNILARICWWSMRTLSENSFGALSQPIQPNMLILGFRTCILPMPVRPIFTKSLCPISICSFRRMAQLPIPRVSHWMLPAIWTWSIIQLTTKNAIFVSFHVRHPFKFKPKLFPPPSDAYIAKIVNVTWFRQSPIMYNPDIDLPEFEIDHVGAEYCNGNEWKLDKIKS
jgi:hypothetical protein